MRIEQFGWWRCHDTEGWRTPEPGDLVAYDFKPWRVIDIREDVEHRDNPDATYTVYRMRPVGEDSANRDIHIGWTHHRHPDVIREHYGLCVHCGELLPCREIMAERAAERDMKNMARYDTPGICPSCEEPVTHRQASETFPNVVVPIGPLVTFHAGRKKCRRALEDYRVKAAQPESQLRLDGGGDA